MYNAKKKAFKYILVTGIVICSLLAGIFKIVPSVRAEAENSDARQAYEEKLKKAQEEKEELEKKKKEQQDLIAEFTSEKENIETYIQELDLQLNDITLRIFELQKEIENTEKELEQTRADLEAAKQTEADQYLTMKKRIAYMYENGETSYIEILLNSGSISDFLNQVEYLGFLIKNGAYIPLNKNKLSGLSCPNSLNESATVLSKEFL